MSIFKETFRDYVRDQLSIRDKVISRGNSGTGDGAALPRRNQSSTVKLQSGKETTLDPGAFYSLFNRQCVIRMTSMTDYVEDVGLDIGINNDDGTRSNSTFASIKGGTLAQNFILQGGVLSDFSRNIKGERSPKRFTTPRGGFPRPGQKTNFSYGDFALGSDATSDGYGIVPMPGIVDANIRTKSAYGSLKEAKVNFVCHNQRQLEVLEMLYMRPGYAVLLEWGWSPYVGNDGRLVNEFKTVEDDISSDVLFSTKVTQQKVFNSINRLKESSSGNYDGMLGFIKNFGYKARPDGGFDCFTELIGMGEVLDSLKVSNTNKILNLDPNNPDYSYNGLTGLIKGLSILTDPDSQTQSTKSAIYKQNFGSFWGPLAEFVSKYVLGTPYDAVIEALAKVYIRSIQGNVEDILLTTLGLKDSSELENYIIKAGSIDELSVGEITLWTFSIQNQLGFIRWDALCALLNFQFIPKDPTEDAAIFISPDRITTKNRKIYIEPLLYVPYNSDDGLIDISCDPNICILPNQLDYNKGNTSSKVKTALGTTPQVNRWSPLSSLGPLLGSNGIRDIVYNSIIGEKSITDEKTNWGENLLDFNDSHRRIGNIFININMLYEIALNNKDNLNYTLGQFVKDIWEKINQACPNHNFQIIDNSNSPIINVIDLGVSNSDIPLDDLYEITPLSNENTLRDFSFESQVPSSLSSTIAIQAQNPRSIENIEDVTFIAFNRSIKNRLIHDDTTSTVDTIEELSQITGNPLSSVKLSELWLSISEYINSFWEYLKQRPQDSKIEVKNISGNIKRYQALIEALKIKNEENTSSTAVIPLSFDATLDGISGIVIGNVFKIKQDRLPKTYKKANVGFIVFGEDQKITPGQDWTTTINGKLIILPTKTTKITQVQSLDPSLNYQIQTQAKKQIAKAYAASTTSTTAVTAPGEARLNTALQNEAREKIVERSLALEKEINPLTGALYTPFEAKLRAELEVAESTTMLMPDNSFTTFTRNPFSAGAYIIVDDLPPLPYGF